MFSFLPSPSLLHPQNPSHPPTTIPVMNIILYFRLKHKIYYSQRDGDARIDCGRATSDWCINTRCNDCLPASTQRSCHYFPFDLCPDNTGTLSPFPSLHAHELFGEERAIVVSWVFLEFLFKSFSFLDVFQFVWNPLMLLLEALWYFCFCYF